MLTDIVRPSQREIEDAMTVISRAAKAMKANGELEPSPEFKRQQARRQALILDCQATAQEAYSRLLDALPDAEKELFLGYAILGAAPYTLNNRNYRAFQQTNRKVKKLLGVQPK